jgi:hypothetical protein
VIEQKFEIFRDFVYAPFGYFSSRLRQRPASYRPRMTVRIFQAQDQRVRTAPYFAPI